VDLLFIVVFVGGFGGTTIWLLWMLILRPYAVASGMIPLTAYDYVVRGWKAERRQLWGIALDEYDQALALEPENEDAHGRRTALLESHPELVDRAE
jgi:hypothetical protein